MTRDKKFTAGTTWNFDDQNSSTVTKSPSQQAREMEEFLETFEAEVSLTDCIGGGDVRNGSSSSSRSSVDGERDCNQEHVSDLEHVNGMVRVNSEINGRYSPSLVAQEEVDESATTVDRATVEDSFLDEMEELIGDEGG